MSTCPTHTHLTQINHSCSIEEQQLRLYLEGVTYIHRLNIFLTLISLDILRGELPASLEHSFSSCFACSTTSSSIIRSSTDELNCIMVFQTLLKRKVYKKRVKSLFSPLCLPFYHVGVYCRLIKLSFGTLLKPDHHPRSNLYTLTWPHPPDGTSTS